MNSGVPMVNDLEKSAGEYDLTKGSSAYSAHEGVLFFLGDRRDYMEFSKMLIQRKGIEDPPETNYYLMAMEAYKDYQAKKEIDEMFQKP